MESWLGFDQGAVKPSRRVGASDLPAKNTRKWPQSKKKCNSGQFSVVEGGSVKMGCYTDPGDDKMPYRVLEIQPTPNPNAVKFVLDRAIAEQPTSFFNPEAAKGHTLAEALFGIPGVTSLLFLGDFVTVNKSPDAQWSEVTARVKTVLSKS
jgi:hypothetical protein